MNTPAPITRIHEINPEVIRAAAVRFCKPTPPATPRQPKNPGDTDRVMEHLRQAGSTTYDRTADACGISYAKAATLLFRLVRQRRARVVEPGKIRMGSKSRPTLFAPQ